MLCYNPEDRYKMADILSSPWLSDPPADVDGVDGLHRPSTTPLSPVNPNRLSSDVERLRSSSQPQHCPPSLTSSNGVVAASHRLCSTQPHDTDCMYLNTQQCFTQLAATQGTGQQNYYQKMVKRMTRFVLADVSPMTALDHLRLIAQDLGYRCDVSTASPSGHLQHAASVYGLDRRKMPLAFRVTAYQAPLPADEVSRAGDGVMLDFRLSKGDGLEFKKLFLLVRKGFCQKVGPVTSAAKWLTQQA
jgi:serine/threonine-protein kinase Chk1